MRRNKLLNLLKLYYNKPTYTTRIHTMKPSELLELHREEIRAIVLRNNGFNPRVFGSVLKGVDTEESDLDILIEPLSGSEVQRNEKVRQQRVRGTGMIIVTA